MNSCKWSLSTGGLCIEGLLNTGSIVVTWECIVHSVHNM